MVERVRLTRALPQRKDLTRDLRERLELLEAQERKIAAELERVREEKGLAARMLEFERQANGGGVLRRPLRHRRDPNQIVRAMLLDAPYVAKKAIVEAAITEGHEAPARAVNIILMGFLRRDFVTRTDDEQYGLTEKGREALRNEAEGAQ